MFNVPALKIRWPAPVCVVLIVPVCVKFNVPELFINVKFAAVVIVPLPDIVNVAPEFTVIPYAVLFNVLPLLLNVTVLPETTTLLSSELSPVISSNCVTVPLFAAAFIASANFS